MITLQKLRKKNKMNLRDFAKSLEMSFQFLSQVENGKRGISIDAIKKICDTYGEDHEAMLIAYGHFPDYTKEARQKDPDSMNKALKRVTKKIMNSQEKA